MGLIEFDDIWIYRGFNLDKCSVWVVDSYGSHHEVRGYVTPERCCTTNQIFFVSDTKKFVYSQCDLPNIASENVLESMMDIIFECAILNSTSQFLTKNNAFKLSELVERK